MKRNSFKAKTIANWRESDPSQSIEDLTARYRREIKRITQQTKNYNVAMGSTHKASEILYYSSKGGDLSQTTRDILSTTAARPKSAGRAAQERISTRVATQMAPKVFDRWSGAINKSNTLKNLKAAYDRGEITLAEFNQRANQWSVDMRKSRQSSDSPTVGSP